MTVPTESPLHMEARLMGETRHNVLDSASQDVAIVGEASSKRGAIVKGVSGGEGDVIQCSF